MRIRLGYELSFNCPQPTPMVLMLKVHPSRRQDLLAPDTIGTDPALNVVDYRDAYGNICSRILAPAGRTTIWTNTAIVDSGLTDDYAPDAVQHDIPFLPEDTLLYLLASRYCDTEQLSNLAWSLFATVPPGWSRVQAICDFVHNHIAFGYQHACNTRTAAGAHADRRGVCRDFAHLAIALCRCMNIPARYCTGYMGDIGIPADPAPMDFSAWFEAYLGGRWYTFDARHNRPRAGRVVIARGRDAADVAICTAFGSHVLETFKVVSEELPVEAMQQRSVA